MYYHTLILFTVHFILASSATSIKEYIEDGVAAAKECMHSGCFFTGLFPEKGQVFFPSVKVFDSHDMVNGDQPNCYRIPSIIQHPKTGLLIAVAEARFGKKVGFFTACKYKMAVLVIPK